jgi:hypothetical protein
MKQTGLRILLCIFVLPLWGQVSDTSMLLQPYRFEQERKMSDEDYTVISLLEDGLALVRERNKFKTGNRTWEVVLLDTTLRQKHMLEIEIDQRKRLTAYEYAPGYLFLVFKTGDASRLTLDLFSISLDDASVKRNEINPELNYQLTHFIRVRDNFILGGYVNNEPAVLLYSTQAENIKVLPGFFQKQTELLDIRPNINGTFNIILMNRVERYNQKLIFKTFDASGIELLDDAIAVDEQYGIQSAISSTLLREDLIITGTWGSRGSKQSNGFFFVTVDPFEQQTIQYIAFGELNHYLDGQKPGRASRIKAKTLDARKNNRIPDFTNYVVPYRMHENESGFMILAETYIPSNTLNRYPDPNPYTGYGTWPNYAPFWGYYPGTYNRLYNPYSYYGNTTRNADEIKATQAVVISFNERGEIQWDTNLGLQDYRMPALEQVSDFAVDENKTCFLYKNESEIILKTISLDGQTAREGKEKIRLLNEGDEIRNEIKTAGTVRQWYGNNFYVWGQHTIRNKSVREEGNKQVFYINKLVCR